MTLSDADLQLMLRALGEYRPPGQAAEVLDLLGRLHQEVLRRRTVAEELGPSDGKPVLVPLPGGRRDGT